MASFLYFLLAVMGQLLAIILRMKIKFSETYKMGIYALTLPTLLELIYIIVNNTFFFHYQIPSILILAN